jgi:hypothetical protein
MNENNIKIRENKEKKRSDVQGSGEAPLVYINIT